MDSGSRPAALPGMTAGVMFVVSVKLVLDPGWNPVLKKGVYERGNTECYACAGASAAGAVSGVATSLVVGMTTRSPLIRAAFPERLRR